MKITLRLLLVLLGLGLLASQLRDYGPTGDPDPDGYVTYAKHLAARWELLEHRRLPGYPAVIAVVHGAFGGDVNKEMFWVHFVLILAFAAGTTALVWHLCGFLTALFYLGILALGSHFARNAIVMLADLPFIYAFYAACVAGFALWVSKTAWKAIALATIFTALCFVSTSLHPSTHLRMQILVVTAAIVLAARAAWQRTPIVPVIMRAIVLSGLCFVANYAALSSLQVRSGHHAYITQDPISSSEFLRGWIAYRMLLCLPPVQDASDLDTKIERVKDLYRERSGIPAGATVPPGFHPEFMALVSAVQVPLDHWKPRLWEHPGSLLKCMLQELRSKYHTILRNILPFGDFKSGKTWITSGYPVYSGGPRDHLFWSTGVNLFESLGPSESSERVRIRALIEIFKAGLSLLLAVGAFVAIERRWQNVGWVLGLSTLALLVVLSVALPVETRYLAPVLPVLYLGQAMIMERLFRYAVA